MFVLALFIPSAGQCLRFAGPLVSLLGLVWLARNARTLVERLFPGLQWARQLGWLNLRAHRQADSALRWVGHVVHAVLLLALVGILESAAFFGGLDPEARPENALFLWLHGVGFLSCLGIWVMYLTTILAPKIRDEYEREELARYRAEHPDRPPEEHRFGQRGAGGQDGITIWESPFPSSDRRR
jgi:hypothetical protein